MCFFSSLSDGMWKPFNKYMPLHLYNSFKLQTAFSNYYRKPLYLVAVLNYFFIGLGCVLVKAELFGQPHIQDCLPMINIAHINHAWAVCVDRKGADCKPQVYLRDL